MYKPKKLSLFFILLFVLGVAAILWYINIIFEKSSTQSSKTIDKIAFYQALQD